VNEIEVKILEVNSDFLRKILKKNGAKLVKKVFQQNFRYYTPYTKKSHITVRVRKENERKHERAILTVKANKRIVNSHKVMDEYETDVDFKNIVPILETMGLKEYALTEMKREYWRIKDCSVEFCIVPTIPEFMEIEGTPKNIDYVAKLLGYLPKDYVVDEMHKHYNITTKYLKF
jgi:predicted adenylyl cyclase CyaB